MPFLDTGKPQFSVQYEPSLKDNPDKTIVCDVGTQYFLHGMKLQLK